MGSLGRPHRSWRLLVAITGMLLASSLLTVSPAAAHVFSKNDANDSPSKIDIRTVSVSHTSTSVVHKVRTWNSWTPASLQHDSFFWFGINKDGDAAYERCAFIYYTTRLRGQLSNCGAQFIRFLPVAKVNATTAKITIPKIQLGGAYRWFGGSAWLGAPPCANGCSDFAPNNLPDLLHDLTRPTIDLDDGWIRLWEDSTTYDFTYSFTVDDANTNVSSWKLQRRLKGATTWTQVDSGAGEGLKEIPVVGEPGRWTYRVVATDSQANTRIVTGLVDVPIDDADLDPAAFTGTPTEVPNVDAFGGTYTELDPGESFSYTPSALTPCEFTMVGPSGAGWHIDVYIGGVFFTSRDWFDVPFGQRVITLNILCTPSEEIRVDVSSAVFGIDAILP